MSQLDGQAYKDKQRSGWNSAAAGWAKWVETFELGGRVASDRMVDLAGVGPGHRVFRRRGHAQQTRPRTGRSRRKLRGNKRRLEVGLCAGDGHGKAGDLHPADPDHARVLALGQPIRTVSTNRFVLASDETKTHWHVQCGANRHVARPHGLLAGSNHRLVVPGDGADDGGSRRAALLF